MSSILLRAVHKRFGRLDVLHDLNLSIDAGQLAVILGPSGCGKTTLLRIVAGLESVDRGELWIDGQRAEAVPPHRRGVAMVFQEGALYPHLNVADNMAFGLRMAGVPRARRLSKVRQVAKLLHLEQLLDRQPAALSGGERQRVAIGRALAREPRVLLLDEPFANLDAALRGQLQVELARLHRTLNTTIVHVTHDQAEAMALADKIAVLHGGVIQQFGAPPELYHRPRNLFVARFVGWPAMNLLDARAESSDDEVTSLRVPDVNSVLQLGSGASELRPGEQVTLGIRPEHISVGEPPTARGPIRLVQSLGHECLIHVQVSSQRTLTVRVTSGVEFHVGQRVGLQFDLKRCHVFRRDGNA
jgi:multiple sugar transport system ATP-binding protein